MRHVLVTFGRSPAHAGRDTPVAMKIHFYVRKLKRFGMEPIFVWPDMAVNIRALYDWADAVLLTGGGDFDPTHYGQEPHRLTDLDIPGRDDMEIELAKWIFRDKKPVLGICRGCQALAIARGGSLLQHIPDLGISERHGKSEHLHTAEEMVAAKEMHDVLIDTGSRTYRLLGKNKVSVNTFHHQMVEKPGVGIAIVGKSPAGVTEIIESTDRNHWCFGVQSHPERFETSDLDAFFKGLSEAR